MPRKILIVLAIIAVAIVCNVTARALTVDQPKPTPTDLTRKSYNPQQPAFKCWQNCTLVPSPPNVMGY